MQEGPKKQDIEIHNCANIFTKRYQERMCMRMNECTNMLKFLNINYMGKVSVQNALHENKFRVEDDKGGKCADESKRLEIAYSPLT